MRKIIIVSFCLITGVSFLMPQKNVWAVVQCPTYEYQPTPLLDTSSEVTFTTGPVVTGNQYKIEVDCSDITPPTVFSPPLTPAGTNDFVEHTFQNSGGSACIFMPGTRNVSLWKIGDKSPLCTRTYEVRGTPSACRLDYEPKDPTTESVITITGSSVPKEASDLVISGLNKLFRIKVNPDKTFSVSIGKLSSGNHSVHVYTLLPSEAGGKLIDIGCPELPLYINMPGTAPIPPGAPTTGCDQCGRCTGKTEPDYWNKCNACITGITLAGQPGAWTALGCISTNPSDFISWLLQKVIGIAGGIAFLLILFGGFQILTSAGNPEKLTSGKEIVVSAIAGLLMIIFSVLLLRVIGYDILQIPGF